MQHVKQDMNVLAELVSTLPSLLNLSGLLTLSGLKLSQQKGDSTVAVLLMT